MSHGALKLGNDQYVDAASHRVIPGEWIEGLDYLKKRDDGLANKRPGCATNANPTTK